MSYQNKARAVIAAKGSKLTLEDRRLIGLALVEINTSVNESKPKFNEALEGTEFETLQKNYRAECMWLAKDEHWTFYTDPHNIVDGTWNISVARKSYNAAVAEKKGPLAQRVREAMPVGVAMTAKQVAEALQLDGSRDVSRNMNDMFHKGLMTRKGRAYVRLDKPDPSNKPDTLGDLWTPMRRALDAVGKYIKAGKPEYFSDPEKPYEDGRSDMRLVRIDGGDAWVDDMSEPFIDDLSKWNDLGHGELIGHTDAYMVRVVVEKVKVRIEKAPEGVSGFVTKVVG